VSVLLAEGSVVDTRNDAGVGSLELASRRNRAACVAELVRHYPHDSRDARLKKARDLAAALLAGTLGSHLEAVRVLVDSGARAGESIRKGAESPVMAARRVFREQGGLEEEEEEEEEVAINELEESDGPQKPKHATLARARNVTLDSEQGDQDLNRLKRAREVMQFLNRRAREQRADSWAGWLRELVTW
jgi:hypothetical protein